MVHAIKPTPNANRFFGKFCYVQKFIINKPNDSIGMEFNNYLRLIFKYKFQFTCHLFKLDLVFMNSF